MSKYYIKPTVLYLYTYYYYGFWLLCWKIYFYFGNNHANANDGSKNDEKKTH